MRFRLVAWISAVVIGGGALSACGGGGGGTNPGGQAPPTSELSVAFGARLDARIESFTADVTRLRLVRADGEALELLAAPRRIDWANLGDADALLTRFDAPSGAYVELALEFDFDDAAGWLASSAGPAVLLDANGAPLAGRLEVPLSFADRPLELAGGTRRLIEVALDPHTSFSFADDEQQLVVAPAPLVRVDPAPMPELVASGSLVEVKLDEAAFELALHTRGGAALGRVRCAGDAECVYQVDGVPLAGSIGLELLSRQAAGTPLRVYASFDPAAPTPTARYVEAGLGTELDGHDSIDGHVVARATAAGGATVLTVRGIVRDAAHDSVSSADATSVDVRDGATSIVRHADAHPLGADDVNVGQRIRAFGRLLGERLDATRTGDVVRLEPTALFGVVRDSSTEGALTLGLRRIGAWPAREFDWSSSGATPTDPSALVTRTSGPAVDEDAALEARGYFTGVAASATDFATDELVPHDDGSASFVVRNSAGGMNLLAVARPTALYLHITGTPGPDEAALIDRGFGDTLPLPTAPVPSVLPRTGPIVCVLVDDAFDSFEVFTHFASFSEKLARKLAGSGRLVRLTATGKYEPIANFLEAGLVIARLE